MPNFDTLGAVVQNLDGTIDVMKIPPICLSDQATLDEIRCRFVEGPLGTDEKDIFFPTWTKTIHVIKHTDDEDRQAITATGIEKRKVTIESDEQLQSMLQTELEVPGSFTVVLQQCRSKRYSRKAIETSSVSPNTSDTSEESASTYKGVRSSEKQNRLLGGSASLSGNSRSKQNYHHHHHHHHHDLYHHQHRARNRYHHVNQLQTPPCNITQSFGPSCQKRDHHRNEAAVSQETSPVPPALIPAPTFPAALCPPPSFEASEQTFFIYPDAMTYGMYHPQPLVPHFYAVPCNINCYNYVPHGSFPSPWPWV